MAIRNTLATAVQLFKIDEVYAIIGELAPGEEVEVTIDASTVRVELRTPS